MVIVGSPNTVREKLAASQDLAGFNTSLTKTQFGTMPDSMVRENIAADRRGDHPVFPGSVAGRDEGAGGGGVGRAAFSWRSS